jgi:class 3 adenylate cyclase
MKTKLIIIDLLKISNGKLNFLGEKIDLKIINCLSKDDLSFLFNNKPEPKSTFIFLILGSNKDVNEGIFNENFNLIRDLRNKNFYRQSPIIFFGFKGDSILKLACLSAGVTEYIDFPIRKTEITHKIETYHHICNEISNLKEEIYIATDIQDMIWKEAKAKRKGLEKELKSIRADLDAQMMAHEAAFELSRQELLEANQKIKEKYESEIKALKEKNKIETLFGKYVSPEIVERVMDPEASKELSGIRREITVFFADIRGFTSISETLGAEKVIFILNEFFTEMTEIIHECTGWVDKYSGDNIMALFGAPIKNESHAENAVRAAFKVAQKFKILKEEWKTIFKINAGLGIGLATGETIIGNIGSFQKISYTAIGDTVNVAARLESSCRDGSIILNERCFEQLSGDIRREFSIIYREKVRVKGKSQPLKTYFIQVYPRPGVQKK